MNKTLYNKGYQYTDKPALQVFTSDEYTAEGAWAHTIPEKKVILIRPPERRDPYLPIIEHEVLHNVFPEASEGFVRAVAYNPSYQMLTKRFRLDYR